LNVSKSNEGSVISSKDRNKELIYSGARVSALITILAILAGGTFDWAFINQQEYSVSLVNAQVDYLSSYASAFLIAAIEIGAAYYFLQKYELGSERKLTGRALVIGIVGFLIYLIGEVVTGIGSLGQVSIPFPTLLYNELTPSVLDYGNALIILISLFGMVLLLEVLLKINPIPRSDSALSNGAGFAGSLWTSIVTTTSAMVCCGPLPGAIALATGVSSLYFTALINIQSFIILISVPLILVAIFVADRRAMKGCKIRDITDFS
jgi:hypothetical protein